MPTSEEEPDRSLLDGFEPEIFKLVREHATPEQWREWLRTPLEHAAAKGNTDLFTRLLDAGADGSAGYRGCHGRTLLIAAVQGKSDGMVRRLLKAGAKPDVNVLFRGDGTYDEYTCCGSALHGAASLGVEAVSRVLLHAGADPNFRDSEIRSPLHVAAAHGRHGVAAVLLLKGADPSVKDDMDVTPLHLAAEGGHSLCVSELLQGGADVNARDFRGDTPVLEAAKEDKVDTFEELVAAGANFEVRNAWGSSVLDCAAYHGSTGVLRSVLRYGVDINAADDNGGLTALHRASQNQLPWENNSGVVRILLQAGADTEAKTTDTSSTPLDLAVSRSDASRATTLALLEGGAAVNARRELGKTPLHTACGCSNVDAVELLLRWGADETLTDEDGQTAGDVVGAWEQDEDEDSDDVDDEDSPYKRRRADDRRILHALARAPADRAWRRRGWLVLCRSHPDQVPLAVPISRRRSSGKEAKTIGEGSGGVGAGTGDDTVDLPRLVRNVVELDADAIFRLVVGFL